ncbi:2'-5' RNA ligase [Sphingomonas sp. So64.6b]|uniref:2'-5' RNA ligase family protein n=1 Tax=Sphingomonas sp. So64.6b TaxID=2997354 RepID=UPI001603714D|nr:2'-5' RNA ligase family protein [Sphingomonas sp. So64.6b]QNA85807.1 2'-5' RNA ligase [Sphingomonas sp. So64.6b]
MFENKISVRHRFFFALLPPAIIARQIVSVMQPFAGGGRMMQAERLHITLDILDDFERWPEKVVAALLAVGEEITAAPFEVVLDRVSGGTETIALRPRLKNASLDALRAKIAAAMARMGLSQRQDYRFSPHMTLAYRDGAPISKLAPPVRWRAEEFVLIHSLLGQTRHEVLGRWTLKGLDEQPSLF